MAYLEFRPTDAHFAENLRAIRQVRLGSRLFNEAFVVQIEGQPARGAKSAYMRPDGYFEFDGIRVHGERVIKVSVLATSIGGQR